MVGIESKVIERAPANGVRVLVLGEGLRTPAYGADCLVRGPGSVAESRVPLGSIIGESGMIKRSVKANAGERDRASQGNGEGLDRAVEVLVIDRVLVMPDPGNRSRHFVGNESAPIGSGRRFDRID